MIASEIWGDDKTDRRKLVSFLDFIPRDIQNGSFPSERENTNI